MRAGEDIGSSVWARDRLRALPADETWVETEACQELISWLYAVARHRAVGAGVTVDERDEVAQDAMPAIVSALNRSRENFARAGNPAAVLERVVTRAVLCGAHRIRMRGLGGVSANGRNWGIPYPSSIGGDVALRLLEDVADSQLPRCREVQDAAETVAGWVTTNIGVSFSEDAAHAVVYVLDRLVSGRARTALVRGNRVGLSSDPAMSYLGFDPAGAGVFARWLLGRSDPGHERPSVLDAALLGETVPLHVLSAWRRTAVDAGFAREQSDAAVIPLPDRSQPSSRDIA